MENVKLRRYVYVRNRKRFRLRNITVSLNASRSAELNGVCNTWVHGTNQVLLTPEQHAVRSDRLHALVVRFTITR